MATKKRALSLREQEAIETVYAGFERYLNSYQAVEHYRRWRKGTAMPSLVAVWPELGDDEDARSVNS